MLFPMVRGWIEDMLSVKGTGSVTPNVKDCAGATVPDTLYNKQVPADLVIITTVVNDPNMQYIATATPCLLDSTTNRPLMGNINVNLKYIDPNFDTMPSTFATVIHE